MAGDQLEVSDARQVWMLRAQRLEAPLAKDRLDAKSDFFKNELFDANFALLAGLQGAWQVGNDLDYKLAKVPAKAQLRVHRDEINGAWNYETQAGWEDNSWVNESSRRLGEMLAESGVSTLIFLPRNKHYSFTVGGNLILSEQTRRPLCERPHKEFVLFSLWLKMNLGYLARLPT